MTKKSIKGHTHRTIFSGGLHGRIRSLHALRTYYAKQAEKRHKYFPVKQIFLLETADNELRHGKTFFEFLEGGSVVK